MLAIGDDVSIVDDLAPHTATSIKMVHFRGDEGAGDDVCRSMLCRNKHNTLELNEHCYLRQ
jgi:hypothetical protein